MSTITPVTRTSQQVADENRSAPRRASPRISPLTWLLPAIDGEPVTDHPQPRAGQMLGVERVDSPGRSPSGRVRCRRRPAAQTAGIPTADQPGQPDQLGNQQLITSIKARRARRPTRSAAGRAIARIGARRRKDFRTTGIEPNATRHHHVGDQGASRGDLQMVSASSSAR